MNRSLVTFEFENSPLHTIAYDGTGTGKTYLVGQYLKLHQNQDGEGVVGPGWCNKACPSPAWSATHQEQEQKSMLEQEQEQNSMMEQEHGEGASGSGSPAWTKFHYQRSMAEHGEAWTKSHDRRSMAEHDQMSIIIVCKDERDWISPETGDPYGEFNMCDISVITTQNILKFQNSVIVLDDMGDKFISYIQYYFTEGRHKNIEMIVMCHKPAQKNNMS